MMNADLSVSTTDGQGAEPAACGSGEGSVDAAAGGNALVGSEQEPFGLRTGATR